MRKFMAENGDGCTDSIDPTGAESYAYSQAVAKVV